MLCSANVIDFSFSPFHVFLVSPLDKGLTFLQILMHADDGIDKRVELNNNSIGGMLVDDPCKAVNPMQNPRGKEYTTCHTCHQESTTKSTSAELYSCNCKAKSKLDSSISGSRQW
jgi:hypothetical protein